LTFGRIQYNITKGKRKRESETKCFLKIVDRGKGRSKRGSKKELNLRGYCRRPERDIYI
jgi:hypothetical protein